MQARSIALERGLGVKRSRHWNKKTKSSGNGDASDLRPLDAQHARLYVTAMATLRDYYETDFPYALRIRVHVDCGGEPVESTLLWDVNGHAAFLSCFVPGMRTAAFFGQLLKGLDWGHTPLQFDGTVQLAAARFVPGCTFEIGSSDRLVVNARFAGNPVPFSVTDACSTRRVFIYHDAQLSESEVRRLQSEAKTIGIHLQVRGEGYRSAREASERPVAFISYDAQDRAIAQSIAISLGSLGCPVWYDEFRLKVGDSLRRSIESGLRQCRHCIVILSPHYLANQGWARREYDSVFTRENVQKRRLFLPVWCGVSAGEVLEYSPSLADVKATIWTGDPGSREAVCKELHRSIMASGDFASGDSEAQPH